MFQSLLRGVGEVKIPLYINGATLLLNFFLDPLFIYGWGPIQAYGVTGAAVSTLVTQFLSIAVGMYILFKGTTEIKLSMKAFSFDWPLLKKAFKLGFPFFNRNFGQGLRPYAYDCFGGPFRHGSVGCLRSGLSLN